MTDPLQKHENLIEVVRTTTIEVFSTMLGVEVAALAPTVAKQLTTRNSGLVAIVGMAGAVSGSGSFCLSQNLACRVSSRFLMQDPEFDEVNDDVLDAVAELSNMIVGGLKTILEEQFGPMGLSIPQIVFGENYVTRSSSAGDRIAIPFECQDGGEIFNVVICIITDTNNRDYLREIATFNAQM